MEDFFKLIRGRSIPGILIFDLRNHLLYFNNQALDFISDFKKTSKPKIKVPFLIPNEIINLCDELKKSIGKKKWDFRKDVKSKILNNIFGAPFFIRAFFIGGSKIINPTHIMVLLEKIVKTHDVNYDKTQKNYKLSDREMDVLKLLIDGFSNKEISNKLFISEFTVKDHIKHILQKMGVSSRNKVITSLK